MKLYAQDNMFGEVRERQFTLVFSMRELELINGKFNAERKKQLDRCNDTIMYGVDISDKVNALAMICLMIEDKKRIDDDFAESLMLLGSLDTNKKDL